MLNYEEKYPEPRQFMPERFINPDGTINDDHPKTIFGFGRRSGTYRLKVPVAVLTSTSLRICVGRHFADASIWRVIACVLAGFSINKPKDDDLKDVENLDELFKDGLVIHARPFRCSITPRSPEIAELICNMNL